MKNRIQNLAFNRLFKRVKEKRRSANPYKLEEAKHIGIIWNMDDPDAPKSIQKIINELKRPGCFIHTLAFSRKANVTEKQSIHNIILTPKNTSWTGKPKEQEAEEFINTSFDILIDLSIKHEFSLIYALAMNNSRFKLTCNSEHYEFADLFIQAPNKSILDIYDLMKEYVSKF
ncbi:hypothetical protein K4L44_03530 [Halosquirtibacter laminarini]|uniref:Uncharacterized protein n=1 Tax=Halosquirtibacter laminarini TaxID=3374600 RepID=A0AC61NGZ6_9BACT|nr:hypothetical protein K4L44_03530 [Prolixibacteraceae bacterium]